MLLGTELGEASWGHGPSMLDFCVKKPYIVCRLVLKLAKICLRDPPNNLIFIWPPLIWFPGSIPGCREDLRICEPSTVSELYALVDECARAEEGRLAPERAA
jgi:hypothetical protein